MFDQLLTVTVVLLPTIFAVVIELISEDIKHHRFWRVGILLFGILTSVLTFYQIHRADRLAAKDREDAIQKTSEKVSASVSASVSESVSKSVTKSVTDQYTGTIKDLNLQIRNLQADLSAKANRTYQEITGGGQYCWVMALPIAQGQFPLAVFNSGDLPLERCSVVIHKVADAPIIAPSMSIEEIMKRLQPLWAEELGPLSPRKSGGRQTRIVLPAGPYTIDIQTRNDRFSESLTINPTFVEHQGFETLEVRDMNSKLLYAMPEMQKHKSK